MDGYKFQKAVMKVNDLDVNDSSQREIYSKRIDHIFNYFNPIGVWKRFKTPN
jgi:hypothetical protein